jgi:hypothetical protein
MISDKNKKQEGGDGSSNIQADNVNVYNGLSYQDVKDIATDIFKANFLQLKDEAAQIASERAEEISEKILNKIKKDSPKSLEEFSQPAMQDALFTAQKEYAKSGDKELGDLLVDIIVDRAEVSQRNMLQIVLDESLHIAPKLTISQLDTLTLLFLLIRTRRLNVRNFEELKGYYISQVLPFIDNLLQDHEHYNYLEYLRCGNIRTGNYGALEANIKKTYQGFFSKGFTQEDLDNEFQDTSSFSDLIIPFLHDPTKFQLRAFDLNKLEGRMTEKAIPQEVQNKLKGLFNKSTMTNQEVKEKLIDIDPRMEKIFTVWNDSPFNQFELSSVGIAIAHANYRRRTGETMDLSIWIK